MTRNEINAAFWVSFFIGVLANLIFSLDIAREYIAPIMIASCASVVILLFSKPTRKEKQ